MSVEEGSWRDLTGVGTERSTSMRQPYVATTKDGEEKHPQGNNASEQREEPHMTRISVIRSKQASTSTARL